MRSWGRDYPGAKDEQRDLTYSELREAAAGLTARGVEAGDRVALQLPNSVDFLVSALACLWVGAIFVPLSAIDPPARIASVVDDCDPAVVLASPAIEQWHPRAVDVAEVTSPATVAPIDPADRPAYAIYTSGTTGTPKGVMIGRRAFASAVWSWNNMSASTATPVPCACRPSISAARSRRCSRRSPPAGPS